MQDRVSSLESRVQCRRIISRVFGNRAKHSLCAGKTTTKHRPRKVSTAKCTRFGAVRNSNKERKCFSVFQYHFVTVQSEYLLGRFNRGWEKSVHLQRSCTSVWRILDSKRSDSLVAHCWRTRMHACPFSVTRAALSSR
jgi:hypothetical protein